MAQWRWISLSMALMSPLSLSLPPTLAMTPFTSSQRGEGSNWIAALPLGEVSQKVKGVTVLIQDDYANGSGVLVEQKGDRYTVLTAAHVVASPDTTYTITTPDNQTHQTSGRTVKRFANTDMAIITFNSDRTYPTAQIASSQPLKEGMSVYVSGFPSPTAAITNPVYNFTDGKMTARSSKAFQDGYAMVYSNRTLPGMSGGGVFNEQGQLIGIHGRGDVDSSLEASSINTGIRVKTGFNLGIPIETFVSRASELGIILEIKLPEVRPSNPVDDLVVAATLKAQQGNYNGAIADMNQAIRQSPEEARLYLSRASYYSALGRTDTAIQDLSQAIQLNPNLEEAYWLRGNYRQANRDTFGALEDFNQVLRLNPQNSQAYLLRATLHVSQTDYAAAIDDYSAIIRLDPKNTLAYSQRGGIRFIQGNAQGALEDYSKLIALNPKDADAYDRRAHVRRYNGDPDGAIADYQAMARLNPRSARAWNSIADLAAEQNDLDRAIEAYSKIIAITPQDVTPYLRRGELYAKNNQGSKAIADYSKIIELKPFEAYGYILRGYARQETGDRTGAKADFLKLAELHRQKGALDDAQDWQERANQL